MYFILGNMAEFCGSEASDPCWYISSRKWDTTAEGEWECRAQYAHAKLAEVDASEWSVVAGQLTSDSDLGMQAGTVTIIVAKYLFFFISLIPVVFSLRRIWLRSFFRKWPNRFRWDQMWDQMTQNHYWLLFLLCWIWLYILQQTMCPVVQPPVA